MELDLGCWWGMGIMVPYFLSPERKRERERERGGEKKETNQSTDRSERKKEGLKIKWVSRAFKDIG